MVMGFADDLYVHSIFPTIQGEGPFVGRPAVFVRLAGCNLQCPGCDTEYTSTRTKYTPVEILSEVKNLMPPCRDGIRQLVVVTGGEPFRQPLGATVSLLLTIGYRVQIETNGTLYREFAELSERHPRHGNLHIVCSPKTGRVHPKLEPHISAYKYVLAYDAVGDDGLPLRALDHPCGNKGVHRPALDFPRDRVYVQPFDSGNEALNRRHMRAAIRSAEVYGFTLCLQMHKIASLP